ncbi:hypothetical protein GGR28_000568 [Lewinella aquimaris]|uniref:Uncharacterized protein n=1 Tax=Neolewinella aquimaris TaxID=1835722 RepID=A0A840E4D8_9BACT|nr:hypothetical protein [Neolewinella aquimaris]MBB4077967.1 hypothetical protein [Neolewinella aquimaris]
MQQQFQVSYDDGLAVLIDVLLAFVFDGFDAARDLRFLPLGKMQCLVEGVVEESVGLDLGA